MTETRRGGAAETAAAPSDPRSRGRHMHRLVCVHCREVRRWFESARSWRTA